MYNTGGRDGQSHGSNGENMMMASVKRRAEE